MRIRLVQRSGKFVPINPKHTKLYSELQKTYRFRRAGIKLAFKDWTRFRQPRYLLADVDQMAKIPGEMMLAYLAAYRRLKSGRGLA